MLDKFKLPDIADFIFEGLNIKLDPFSFLQTLSPVEMIEKIDDLGASPMDWPELFAVSKALEAEQAQAVEPVATVQCINGVTIGYLDVMQPVGTKLYTHPAPPPAGERAKAAGAHSRKSVCGLR